MNQGLSRIYKHKAAVPWIMWGIACAFAYFQFLIQLSSGVIVKDLISTFHLTGFGAGLLASSYYYVYVTLQVPAGMLLDRYGVAKLLTQGSFVCAIGCVLFAASDSVWIVGLGRLLMGAGTAFAFIGVVAVIRMWFPKSRFAFMVGLTETIAMVGAMVGDVALAGLLEHYGWRQSMWVGVLISLIAALLCGLILKDKTPEKPQKRISSREFKAGVRELLRTPAAWWNGLYCGLLFSLVTVFVALWGVPFIMESLGVSLPLATGIDNVVFIGIAVGCPIVGSLYSRYGRRRPILVVSALSSALLMTLVLVIPLHSVWFATALLFLLGVMSSAYILNYTIADELAPASAKSASIGFANTLAMVTAPIFQPIVGLLLHLMVQGQGLEQEIYTAGNYRLALGLLPILFILAAIVALKVPEKDEQALALPLAVI